MKVRNDEDWSKQEALLNSTPEGQAFMKFMLAWMESAEEVLKGQKEPDLSSAVQFALAATEAQMGYLSVDLIGQMLVVASMHWEHGPEFATALTHIERRVVEEALGRKLADLREAAREAVGNNEPTECARVGVAENSLDTPSGEEEVAHDDH